MVQAFRAGSADLLTNYARWLQRVLTTRGMCSRHIEENFDRLVEAIRSEEIEDAGPALELLEAASLALAYDDGPARAVQVVAMPVAARAAEVVFERHLDWPARLGDRGGESCRDDVLYQLSYLADAIANGRPDLFGDHVRWTAGFFERRGRPSGYLRETLLSLDDVIPHTPAPERATVGTVLQAGHAALAQGADPSGA